MPNFGFGIPQGYPIQSGDPGKVWLSAETANRDAEELQMQMAGSQETQRIKALDAAVVNKIAAGEIIIGPANALKELLENSIDAGSTSIDITVKDGGSKVLQISDNGSGIHRDDLGILCERFTTSKLSKYEDLEALGTYGFRGEALASISHIAHLSVVTRKADSPCAWRAGYRDGKLNAGDPKPVAGKTGTQITVEDLFYNMPARRRVLRSAGEELAKILRVVGCYAVHSTGVSFSVKKLGETFPSLVISRPDLPVRERIRSVFGSEIANHLLEVSVAPDDSLGLLAGRGFVTDSSFRAKKNVQPVLFINNRLVQCDPLKKALVQACGSFLPKGAHAFVYFSLELRPDYVDVNVHPTKREVRFLHEEEIVSQVVDAVYEVLSSVDASRAFPARQVTFPGLKRGATESSGSETVKKERKLYEYRMVRTDASQGSLASYLNSQSAFAASQMPTETLDAEHEFRTESTEEVTVSDLPKEGRSSGGSGADNGANNGANNGADSDIEDPSSYDRSSAKTQPNLLSVQKLREKVASSTSKTLLKIISGSTFVGVADVERRLMLIQHEVRLLMCDYAALSFELLYQMILSEFGMFGEWKLSEPLSVATLLRAALTDNESGAEEAIEAEVKETVAQLASMSPMLEEYFSIKVDAEVSTEGDILLYSLPVVILNYNPELAKLPLFLASLSPRSIDWESEQACLQAICRQLASFYVPEIVEEVAEQEEDYETYLEKASAVKESVEHVLFPLMKRRIMPSHELEDSIVELADLPGLYKVFERC